jgi:hypothetical protein
LGRGNGKFDSPVDYAVGTRPSSVVVGDFNHDGKADLAVVNIGCPQIRCQTPGFVSVLLGKGDGTFRRAKEYPLDFFPIAAAVGDFNRDGKLDLVVTNFCGSDPNCKSDGSISVLFGNGDGTFQPAAEFSAGSPGAWGIAVADLDGDSKLDFAVTHGSPFSIGANTVSVFLGNGDGTFQPPSDYATGWSPLAVVVRDLNRDGKLDLAIANSNQDSVSILIGKGDGTFQSFVPYSTGFGSTPEDVAVGDFNGDGKLDLVTVDHTSNTLSLLLGNGDGSFQAPADYGVGAYPSALAVGNFNQDHKLDVVTANNDSASLSVLLNSTRKREHLTSLGAGPPHSPLRR